MKLKETRICLNCDEIHKGEKCPRCGIGPSTWLTTWINPLYVEHFLTNFRKAQESLQCGLKGGDDAA